MALLGTGEATGKLPGPQVALPQPILLPLHTLSVLLTLA